MPLWIPSSSAFARLNNADSRRALEAGLTLRPLPETVRDTLAWARAVEKHVGALAAGLSPEREGELLAAARGQERPGQPLLE
jgi:2'-hydroxyisoflavone reductase